MLAEATISNSEQTIYTVPDGKRAFIYVHVYAPELDDVTIKLNNRVYYSDDVVDFISAKMLLDAGDTIKVATSGSVNVFVEGMEM